MARSVISIEPAYPALDCAAFLIERACVPRYYPPRYCAEAAQLLAMLEAARQKMKRPDRPAVSITTLTRRCHFEYRVHNFHPA